MLRYNIGYSTNTTTMRFCTFDYIFPFFYCLYKLIYCACNQFMLSNVLNTFNLDKNIYYRNCCFKEVFKIAFVYTNRKVP